MTTIEETKEFLSEDKFRIRLYDYIVEKSATAVSCTTNEFFP